MKERIVTKPILDTSQALAFATGAIKSENISTHTNKLKKTAQIAKKSLADNRIFFAPEGDKRLTINIKEELHKKLKIKAIEENTTAGDILENLIDKYL